MNLPVMPPLLPMLAKRIASLPEPPPDLANGFQFEPKWDGFRTIIFRDGDELLIQSRDGKPLDRYFPELREPLLQQLPPRCVLDGEIVIARAAGRGGTALDFDALQLRIHPAASRIRLLSKQTPASLVLFDMVALGDRDLSQLPFADRRKELEDLLGDATAPLHVTPASRDKEAGEDWFRRFEGAGLDGVMAKPLRGVYTPDKRTQFKIKHERECDCVVAGFRWHKNGEGTHVGSLLLGLFDGEKLQHVGVCASFTEAKRRELADVLAPYRKDALHNHPWASWSGGEDSSASAEQRKPGAKSRWNRSKDLSWEPLRPDLVAEVAYEHMQGNRFRHLAHFRRWRPDKPSSACTYEQLEVVPPQELMDLFSTESSGKNENSTTIET